MKFTRIDVTTQVDRLKAFRGSGFLRYEDSSLLEPKVVETEKVVKRERDKQDVRDRWDTKF